MTSPGRRPGLVGLGVAHHPPDDGAAVCSAHRTSAASLIRQPLDSQEADRSALDLAVLHQIVDDPPREIARYGEADALVAAALAEDARC